MKKIYVATALLLGSTISIVLAQTPASAKGQETSGSTESLVVDLHASAYRPKLDRKSTRLNSSH